MENTHSSSIPSSSNAPTPTKSSASKPRKRFVGRNTLPTSPKSRSSTHRTSAGTTAVHSSIPADILTDPLLNAAIAQNLPKNYEFEIHKTIWNIRKWNSKMVGLQMPEGLLMWACIISDIIQRFTDAETVILGDVTYGACCIDDYTAIALGCDMLIHYGHSCLVPIDTTTIRTLYVFVEISIDGEHLHRTIRKNLPSNRRQFLDLVTGMREDVMIGTVIAGQKRIEAAPAPPPAPSSSSTSSPSPSTVPLPPAPSSESQSPDLIAGFASSSQSPSSIPLPAPPPSSSSPPPPASTKGSKEKGPAIDVTEEVVEIPQKTRLALVSTIQFAAALDRLKEDLSVPTSAASDHANPNDSRNPTNGVFISTTKVGNLNESNAPFEPVGPSSTNSKESARHSTNPDDLPSTNQITGTTLSRTASSGKENREDGKEASKINHIHTDGVREAVEDGEDSGVYDITVPRSKPLSPGEILGCTAPRLRADEVDAILYLADGRFHLEAIMIANPSIPAFRYDPYSKKLTREWYDHDAMRDARSQAVQSAKASIPLLSSISKVDQKNTEGGSIQASEGNKDEDPQSISKRATSELEGKVWGVILGTLGRQGSLLQMEAILRQLETYPGTGNGIPYMPILLSELSPAKLALFNASSNDVTTSSISTSISTDTGSNAERKKRSHIEAFIQTSCPRLSIDWGYAFEKPLLSPYETAVALGRAIGWDSSSISPSPSSGTAKVALDIPDMHESSDQAINGKAAVQNSNGAYPMDFYEAGSVWANSRLKGRDTVWSITA